MTIQMKAIERYFHVALFVFSIYCKTKFEILKFNVEL